MVATGWGVVAIDDSGAQHVVEDLGSGAGQWNYASTVSVEGHDVVQRVSRAYSDLDGGVVYGTDNAVVWLAADGDRQVLATVPPFSPESIVTDSITLEDVVQIDGAVHVLYTQTTITTGVDFHGSAQLVALPLAGGSPILVETYDWQGTGEDWQYYGQVSYGGDRFAVVRSWNQGSCVWIDLLDAQGALLTGAGPFPEPADPANCPYGQIGGGGIASASLSDDGSELAVLRDDGTLEQYRVDDGSLVSTTDLADVGVLPSGIDFDGTRAAVVDRAECSMAGAEGTCGDLAVPTIARGTLTRTPLATIDDGDPRWVTGTADLVIAVG
jgi:hypothetical protein